MKTEPEERTLKSSILREDSERLLGRGVMRVKMRDGFALSAWAAESLVCASCGLGGVASTGVGTLC